MKKKYLLFSLFSLTTILAGTSIAITSCAKKDESNRPSTPIPPAKLDEKGGMINGLQVSKFLVIVQQLGIDSQTNITTLTNDIINNKLHENNSYSSLILNISKGSEIDGELTLSMNGTYNEQGFQNEEIKISNFATNKFDKNYQINQLNLNYDEWVTNKISLDNRVEIEGLSENKIKNLFQKTTIIVKHNDLEQILTISDLDKWFEFKNLKIKFDGTTKKYILDFTLITKYKEFNGNEWILLPIKKQQTLIKNFNSNNQFDPPNHQDVINILINKLTFKTKELQSYYPSYFYAKFMYDSKVNDSYLSELFDFSNQTEIIQEYNIYTKNLNLTFQLSPSISDFIANDMDGTMQFSVKLKSLTEDINAEKTFTVAQMKHINLDIKNNQWIANNNYALTKQLQNIYKQQIEDLIKSEKNEIEISNFQLPNSIIIYSIENNRGEYNNFLSIQLFGQNLQFKNLLNKDQLGTLNVDNGIINLNNTDKFMVKGIYLDKNQPTKLVLSKRNQNVFANISLNVNIDLMGELITQTTNIQFTLK